MTHLPHPNLQGLSDNLDVIDDEDSGHDFHLPSSPMREACREKTS